MEILNELSLPGMRALATALEEERLKPPYECVAVGRYVKDTDVGTITAALTAMAADGTTPRHIAHTLRLLACERQRTQEQADKVELVWSGQEILGASSLDTRYVVRELFGRAKRHLLLSSYVVDTGKKARTLFEPLVAAMDANADLRVQFYLNVMRDHRDRRADAVLLREFAERFRDKVWKGQRLPEVYHDPRSLEMGGRVKACLHAKCLVVDHCETLITSANYTEAAQDRNTEAGTLIRDKVLADKLIFQFESLRHEGHFQRVPGLSND